MRTGIMQALRKGTKEVVTADHQGVHTYTLGPNNQDGARYEYWETLHHIDGRTSFILHDNGGRHPRKFGPDGYDGDGYNRRHFDREGINRRTGTKFDLHGLDAEGYGKTGFKNGVNRSGFKKDLIHSETEAEFDPEGFNFYGVNLQGINRDGKEDADVAILKDFIATKVSTMTKYARERNLDLEAVRSQIALGLKKAPWLEEQYHQVTTKGLGQLQAIIRREAATVNDGETLRSFWAQHPKLTLESNIFSSETIDKFINIVSGLVADKTLDIKFLIRNFSSNEYDLSAAIDTLVSIRVSSPERETKIKLHAIEKYMRSFLASKLYPGHYTLDGEKFVDLTAEDIKSGEEEMLENKQYVCAKTVKAYLLSKG